MKHSDLNKELGEVSAYPTKQEAYQKDVALLPDDDSSTRDREAAPNQDKQQ